MGTPPPQKEDIWLWEEGEKVCPLWPWQIHGKKLSPNEERELAQGHQTQWPWVPSLPSSKAHPFHNAAFNSSGNWGYYTITPPILFSKLNKKSHWHQTTQLTFILSFQTCRGFHKHPEFKKNTLTEETKAIDMITNLCKSESSQPSPTYAERRSFLFKQP